MNKLRTTSEAVATSTSCSKQMFQAEHRDVIRMKDDNKSKEHYVKNSLKELQMNPKHYVFNVISLQKRYIGVRINTGKSN